ncbi:MAG: toll/interleukin-1 receptor domain-containing protein [Desulfobulbia bacterium]
MSKKVLLVGLKYDGPEIHDAEIEVLGLCRAKVNDSKSAFALYEYDVIIINPESYSHFLFGDATEHSSSEKELWELKTSNNDYDLDAAYDEWDRTKELDAAITRGTKVVWLLTPDKPIHFFGWRSLYSGYANQAVREILRKSTIHNKKSRQLVVSPDAAEFLPYFTSLTVSGWRICFADHPQDINVIAASPEGYCLGAQVKIGNAIAWLLTAPTTIESTNSLVQCAIGSSPVSLPKKTYHGLFLSHTSEDKPFVRTLRQDLIAHGVGDVWLDEAELLVGDSLTKKISEALSKTKYVGVVLSPRSIKSSWVEKELEAAMTKEISTGEVVVLPMLYENCELPTFLMGKLYADFTSQEKYQESLEKILRRLKAT